MQARHYVLVGLVALGFGPACGGDKSIPLADLPPKLAEALCTAYQSCYGPVFELFLNGTDCVFITEQRIRNGTFPMLQNQIDQGKLVYNGAKAQACLDSIAARTCAQMLDRDSPECEAALDGTVEMGGACVLDEDCKGKALCKSSSGTCPGQCVPLLVAGQACGEDGDCQDGLQCSGETRLCVQPAAVGQACDYGAPPCGPGLLCLGKDDDARTSGTCMTPASALVGVQGGPCDPTVGQLCQSGLSCVAESISLVPLEIVWRCVAAGSYDAGASCKPGFPEACVPGYFCKTGTGLEALAGGTCAVIPGTGEACGTGLSQCQPGDVCVSGICQQLAANGVGCTVDAMCLSAYCGPSGGCEARLPCR
ncbi:MAG: hypothetical protein JXP73_01925 [Deltaproteobacteria bacterium]|nr:hypothetical protein [Deltaproteobacteria bacterium]